MAGVACCVGGQEERAEACARALYANHGGGLEAGDARGGAGGEGGK